MASDIAARGTNTNRAVKTRAPSKVKFFRLSLAFMRRDFCIHLQPKQGRGMRSTSWRILSLSSRPIFFILSLSLAGRLVLSILPFFLHHLLLLRLLHLLRGLEIFLLCDLVEPPTVIDVHVRFASLSPGWRWRSRKNKTTTKKKNSKEDWQTGKEEDEPDCVREVHVRTY